MDKKDLRLKFKTPVDGQRFVSKNLNKLLKSYREDYNLYKQENEGKSYIDMIEQNKLSKTVKDVIKNKAKKSLSEIPAKQAHKIREKYNEEKEALKQALDNGEIDKKSYNKKMEYLQYKVKKKMYAKDLHPEINEKPENPRIKRAAKIAKNTLKIAGMIISLPVLGVVAGVKGLGTLAKNTYDKVRVGGKVGLLVAGKTIEKMKDEIQPLKEEVTEYENTKKELRNVEQSKDLENSEKISEKAKIYESKSKTTQDRIYREDYISALKQNKKIDKQNAKTEVQNANSINTEEKQQREEQRREKLHMPKTIQEINHQEAIQKVEEEILTPEEEKEIYGEEEQI